MPRRVTRATAAAGMAMMVALLGLAVLVGDPCVLHPALPTGGPVPLASLPTVRASEGTSVSCPAAASGRATCVGSIAGSDRRSGDGRMPLASPTEGILNWSNETANMSKMGVGPDADFAGLAFDPVIGDMVFFGGCGATVCPTNDTWEYNGYSWENVTSTLSAEADHLPPALQGMGFTWDPAWNGILLTGGELADHAASNQTWLLNSTGWYNETSSVSPSGSTSSSPHQAFGAMAYDDALHEMIVVNGCTAVAAACTSSIPGQTFALGGPSTTWTDLGSTFASGNQSPWSGSSGGMGGQMAFDRGLDEMVYFGGSNATAVVQNSTWVLNQTTGWQNVTVNRSGCTTIPIACYYPPATANGSMTWDGQLGEIILFGGENATGHPTDATYSYNSVGPLGKWYPVPLQSFPLLYDFAMPPAEEDGEMASNSTDVAALLVSGTCAGTCVGDSWALETSPDPAVTSVAPSPTDAGVPVLVSASNAVGSGSGPMLEGVVDDSLGAVTSPTTVSDANFSTTFPFTAKLTFSVAGTYTVWATVTDYFYVLGVSPTVEVVVNASLAAAPTALPNPTEIGTPVDLSAGVPAGSGVPPFTYAWKLGDGGTSTVADPTHSYATTGTYEALVVVTDGVGASANGTVEITVYPTLTAKATTSVSVSDEGIPILFLGAPSGGSGTYTTVQWSFGDHSSSTALDVAHAFSSAGNHTAWFNVTDSAGFVAGTTVNVTVNLPLSVSPITASSSAPTTSTAVTFNVTVRDGTPGYGYSWNFGDQAASIEPSPTHTFASAGTYTVTLFVEDKVGGAVEQRLTLTVTRPSTTPSFLGWISHGLGLYLMAGILAAAAFLIAVVVLERRRRREDDRSDEEPPGPSGPSPKVDQESKGPAGPS